MLERFRIIGFPMQSRSLAFLLMTVASGVQASGTESAAVVTEHTRASLITDAQQDVVAGGEITVGLQLEHQPGWHSYWKNPGDSGLPTTMRWTLPTGVVAGPIAWPTPAQFRDGPLLNFGYGGAVLLPVRITIPADFKADVLEIGVRARWLVCAEICIAEAGEFALRLPAGKAVAQERLPATNDAFARTQARFPIDLGGIVPARVTGTQVVFSMAQLPEAYRGKDLELYPETGGVVDHSEPVLQAWAERSWTARLPVSPQRSESPEFLDIVVKLPGEPSGSRIRLQIEGWSSP